MKDEEKRIEEMATCEKCVHGEICFNRVGICRNYTKEIVKKYGCKYYQPKIDKDKEVIVSKKEVKIYQEIYDFMKEFNLVSVEETKTFIKFWQKSYENKWTIEQQAGKKTADKIYHELQGHGTTYVKKWIEKEFGLGINK